MNNDIKGLTRIDKSNTKHAIEALVKAFPDKEEKSMIGTIKAQIGSSKRPVRMERERSIKFTIETKESIKYYSL